MLKLWKYNQRTGYWDLQRTITNPEDGQRWLDIFQKDEPQESFVVSKTRPSKPPTMKTFRSFVRESVLQEKERLKQNVAGSSTMWEQYLADALTAAANPKLQNIIGHSEEILNLAKKHEILRRRKTVLQREFKKEVKELTNKLSPTSKTYKILTDPKFNPYEYARKLWVWSRSEEQFQAVTTPETPKEFNGEPLTTPLKDILRQALVKANKEWRIQRVGLSDDKQVIAIAKENVKQYYPQAPVFTEDGTFRFSSKGIRSKEHQKFAADAYAIAQIMVAKNPTLKGKLFHHTGSDKVGISDAYQAYGGSDQTPKADIISIPEGYRFSLKNAQTGSQIAAGQTADGLAMFNLTKDRYTEVFKGRPLKNLNTVERVMRETLAAVEFDLTDEDLQKLDKLIDIEHFDKPTSAKPGLMKAAWELYSGIVAPKFRPLTQNPRIMNLFGALTLKDYEIKNDLGEALVDSLNTNIEFRDMFVFENASGAGKFGGKVAPITLNKPYGSANYLLTFAPNFPTNTTQNKIEELNTWQAPAIKETAKSVKFNVRWRHIGAESATTAIQVMVPAATKKELRAERTYTLESLFHEEFEQFMLSEGLFDSVKDTAQTIAGKIKVWWTKFKAWWRQFIDIAVQKLKSVASEGLDAILNFLGLEAEAVQTSGPEWLFS